MIDATDYTGQDGNLPWLCLRNEVTDATITASSAATGYDAEAVRGPQTYSQWSPASLPAWVRAEFATPSDATINYFAAYIADGGGCTFTAEYWDGATWQVIGFPATVAAGENACLLWILDVVPAGDIRLSVDGDTDALPPYVATLKAGMADFIPYCPPVGFSPSSLNPDDEYTNTFSRGGQVLGSELLSSRASETLNIDIMKPAWVRANWPTIRTLMRTEGVVFAWRPAVYQELIYGMVTGTPSVAYSQHTRMTMSFTVEGPAL